MRDIDGPRRRMERSWEDEFQFIGKTKSSLQVNLERKNDNWLVGKERLLGGKEKNICLEGKKRTFAWSPSKLNK